MDLRGPTSKGREGGGRDGEGGKREGEGKGGKGREKRGTPLQSTPPVKKSWIRACFQSHAAVVKRYNAFCAKLTANSDTERNNISKSTFPVCVSIFTFNELWNVTFCRKTRRVCNVRRQNSCDKFYKVV